MLTTRLPSLRRTPFALRLILVIVSYFVLIVVIKALPAPQHEPSAAAYGLSRLLAVVKLSLPGVWLAWQAGRNGVIIGLKINLTFQRWATRLVGFVVGVQGALMASISAFLVSVPASASFASQGRLAIGWLLFMAALGVVSLRIRPELHDQQKGQPSDRPNRWK